MAPRLDNTKALADLPKITRYVGMTDHGPADDNGVAPTTCPHCGSPGRYVHHFEVEGGYTASAMSGCIRLFGITRLAQEDMKLSEKERELAGKKWNPNSWQKKMREAIEAAYKGEITEDEALRTIDRQKAASAAYYEQKRRNRR
jgi:hypothetical protein